MKYDYAKARLTLDVLNQALSLLDSGLTMRALKAEFLHTQLVANFPEGGVTVGIYDRLNVCRSKKTFREAVDGITTVYIAPVMRQQERRLAEIRAYDEERAQLTVDQAYDKALAQDADLRRYWLERSRPNYPELLTLQPESRARAIAYAHEEALEMDKARGVPPFPGVKAAPMPPVAKTAAFAPTMPMAQIPVASGPDAAVYLSGALQVGDRIEVRYALGEVEEIRRVYQLVSLPVRVVNTCYQVFHAKQIGDRRVHRIAFNATTDGWTLYERKEAE